jgi:hypothetical protein
VLWARPVAEVNVQAWKDISLQELMERVSKNDEKIDPRGFGYRNVNFKLPKPRTKRIFRGPPKPSWVEHISSILFIAFPRKTKLQKQVLTTHIYKINFG